jgi:predicted Rossmann fold nucleotide-binding protein DprA/Smf involved in DNA uptake
MVADSARRTGIALTEKQGIAWLRRQRATTDRRSAWTTPVNIDDVIRHTGLPASSVYLVLLELDFAARLHRHPGGLVSVAMLD